MNCGRSEIRGQSGCPCTRAPRRVLFFIFYLSVPSLVHTPLFNSHLASRSTPTKAKMVGVSESLALLRALWGDASYACLLFPPNLKTRLHVADRFKFFHQPGGSYRHCGPSCSCYKSVMRLRICSPSVFTVSNPPLQLIRRPCLPLPTRSCPGRPRTPVRASSLAHGVSCIDSR